MENTKGVSTPLRTLCYLDKEEGDKKYRKTNIKVLSIPLFKLLLLVIISCFMSLCAFQVKPN